MIRRGTRDRAFIIREDWVCMRRRTTQHIQQHSTSSSTVHHEIMKDKIE
jgi:hypothetical protein